MLERETREFTPRTIDIFTLLNLESNIESYDEVIYLPDFQKYSYLPSYRIVHEIEQVSCSFNHPRKVLNQKM